MFVFYGLTNKTPGFAQGLDFNQDDIQQMKKQLRT